MDKDYYNILGITHTASEQEIKKAYRQLVMKFHPDRNEGDRMAEDQFKEVQEAYETLSHTGRRSAYNQQRWYRQSSSKQPVNSKITSYTIFKKCSDLNRYMSTLDRYRINPQALSNYIIQILSGSTIQLLIEENDTTTNELIIKEVLKSIDPLPFKSIADIVQALTMLANNDVETIKSINTYLKEKKSSDYWSTYTPLVALIIAILICLLIYIFSNNNS